MHVYCMLVWPLYSLCLDMYWSEHTTSSSKQCLGMSENVAFFQEGALQTKVCWDLVEVGSH